MKSSQMLQRIKQIKSWRSLVILTVGLMLGILLDTIVSETGRALVYVGEDYLNEVFGATGCIPNSV